MFMVCLDLEGIFTPEVWIRVALETGIDELKLTTRDISDYDKLMKRRLKILKDHGITLSFIQGIIKKMDLLPGALDFINWLRPRTQFIILSDTFIEFGMPFMEKLGYPTLFCHNLIVDENDIILDYKLRIDNMKEKTVIALRKMKYEVIAIGDSYNDTGMLIKADHGILYNPPPNVIDEFSQFPIANSYSDLKTLISKYLKLSE
ncbi:MAG: bifunctional phosphoserine phosphatase/homoserine phosphotransferase ThrH [Candidatus Lokiarchaeota archaeon]|nr:bifunctional phosphoserine phosphatase/homoserine phosphotransferase ThrH [Candidatus Lokiarchaeota archaeon]